MKISQSVPAERRFTITRFNERFLDDDACIDSKPMFISFLDQVVAKAE